FLLAKALTGHDPDVPDAWQFPVKSISCRGQALVNGAARASPRADVEGVLGAAIAGALALELAVSLLFCLGFLQGNDLRLGQDQAFLCDLRFQGLQPLLHCLKIMA